MSAEVLLHLSNS